MGRWCVLLAGLLACGGAAKSPTARAPAPAPAASTPSPPEPTESAESEDDADMMVSNELVHACPELTLVHNHSDEIDPDKLWVVVLVAIGDCMQEGGALEAQSIGVSGDESHRSVVRAVLGHLGIKPSRVHATTSQDGNPKTVEISLMKEESEY